MAPTGYFLQNSTVRSTAANLLKATSKLLVATLALAAASVPALAEKRVALVIGNSAYKNAAPLKNPKNDATDMATKLRTYGFEVISGTDLNRDGLERKIRDFSSAITDADVALFYYAGHGLQVNGTNYLAPVDASLKEEADLDFESVRLDLVLRQMQRTKRVNLVFLDACRNNPLANTLGKASRSLNVASGLAAVDKTAGMLISFATEPGNVALDGDGRNSPFTKALLKHMDTTDASINDVMIEVRKDVMAATNSSQVPWENSSLTGRFYFNKNRSVAATPSQPKTQTAAKVITVADATVEHTFWTSVEASKSPELYKVYLQRYPNGVYAPIAKARVAAVRSIAVEPRQTATSAKSTASGVKLASLNTGTANDATTGAPVATAAAPALTTPAPVASPYMLAVHLQTELKRVGCYNGKIDGAWGRGSRGSVHMFNAHAKTGLDANTPVQSTIDVVAAHQHRVCPVVQQVRHTPKVKRNRATRNVAPARRAPTRQARRSQPRRQQAPRRRPVAPAPAPRPRVTLGFTKRGGKSTLSIGIGAVGGVFRF